jgi:hypothetical protein
VRSLPSPAVSACRVETVIAERLANYMPDIPLRNF